MRPARLVVSEKAKIDSDFWVEEAIWGNRLYNEQTPWMTLLEMLGVLATRQGVDPFRELEGAGGVEYQPLRRMELRNVLFNNPFLDEVERRHGNNAERWDAWLAKMKGEVKGLDGDGGGDFSYLRGVFVDRENSFAQFADLVRLLRSTAIEGDSNKRWTSKFVFPYGPACLYPDLNIRANGTATVDRRFFARTGELLYLMLCRSGRGAELYEKLRPVVLEPSAPWNRLVERMQPPAGGVTSSAKTSFLPYERLPDFTALAGDLITVLDAKLPGYDALPHLVDLVGLHLVLYILRRAAEWTPELGPLRLVVEIIAPRRTTVRDLAVESFTRNNQRPWEAVKSFLTETVEHSPEWRKACAIVDDDERADDLAKVLHDKVRADSPGGGTDRKVASPDRLLQSLRDAVLKRHEQHFAETHAAYAQAIGLASRRGARRIRYAPSDQLLKTLVLTVVPVGDRMEFQRFLATLWERFHMVIGHHQAAEILKDGHGDRSDFEDNARRLEMRLESLGLLTRLSDACAYVESPIRGAR